MKTIAIVVTVGPDGTVSGRVPPDVPPGEHRVVLVLDAGARWAQAAVTPPTAPGPHLLLDFPVDDLGPGYPPGAADLSLRREEMYGDVGRCANRRGAGPWLGLQRQVDHLIAHVSGFARPRDDLEIMNTCPDRNPQGVSIYNAGEGQPGLLPARGFGEQVIVA